MINFSIFLTIASTFYLSDVEAALQKVNSGWSSPITYKIGTGIPAATRTKIIDLLAQNGPIRSLVPGLSFFNNDAVTVFPYIEFLSNSTRTYCEDENVQIGPQSGAKTDIIITESATINCATQGWMLHLVMHAIGFYHEHQRPDRNSYVYVNAANSVLSAAAKAALLDIKTGGIIVNSAPYDFASVMHYDYQASAATGKQTIVALPAEYYSVRSYGHATNRDYTASSVLSSGDVAALQALFPGTAVSIPPQICSNGGTWHNWCLCKPGYAGRFCTETYCYQPCQNSGYCSVNPTTGLPGCVCPTGYSGTYCEIPGSSPNCSSAGTCPWWSSCNVPYAMCTCDPYPFYGPTCAVATSAVPTTSTTSTVATSTVSSAASSSTPASGGAGMTTHSTITCTATNVGAPRSVTFTPNAVYLRMALADIPYQQEYANLGNPQSVALQNFLAEALQGDYQTQTSGQFISVHIQNIQPPVPGTSSGCVVVDYLAKFTSNLTPLQRTHVVQATYAKAHSSNLPSLFGTLGTDKNKATIVSSVLYITPLNSAISPASPCVVFSSEGACKNGGTCQGVGTEPSCVCQTGNRGTFCENPNSSNNSSGGVTLAWPIWQIVVVSIAAAIALLLFILLVAFFVRQSQQKSMYNYGYGPDRYYEYDLRARQMQMAPTYLVPAEPQPVQTYYPQAGAYPAGPSAVPPPYSGGGGGTFQRPKHYQYPFNIQ